MAGEGRVDGVVDAGRCVAGPVDQQKGRAPGKAEAECLDTAAVAAGEAGTGGWPDNVEVGMGAVLHDHAARLVRKESNL